MVKKMPEKYEILADVILIDLLLNHNGKNNAVHSRELERRYNISGRVLRSIIRDLRLTGKYPICSCSKGYFYPRTPYEVYETFSRLSASSKSYSILCYNLINNRQNISNAGIFGGFYNDEY